jgi:hypothetical protein
MTTIISARTLRRKAARECWRVLAALIAAGAVLAPVAGAAQAQAMTPVHLKTAVEIGLPPNSGAVAKLWGVTRPGPGSCVAVGDYQDQSGHRQAMRVSQSTGEWPQASRLGQPDSATT